jgi:hypothetical protein
MSLTSHSVTLDGEKITVVQGLETVTVCWDDPSRIALDDPSGRLLVWFHDEKAAKYSYLYQSVDFEDGTGRLLYTCARKDDKYKAPQKLEDYQLRSYLKEYAGELYRQDSTYEEAPPEETGSTGFRARSRSGPGFQA